MLLLQRVILSRIFEENKNKKGAYLQIYERYYDPERKGGAHRSTKPLGYVHELIEKGINDLLLTSLPISTTSALYPFCSIIIIPLYYALFVKEIPHN